MKMNHRLSTIALIAMITIGIIGAIVGALTSDDIDPLCSTDNKILKRIGGTWVCSDDLSGNGSTTIIPNSVQCPPGQVLWNVGINESSDLSAICIPALTNINNTCKLNIASSKRNTVLWNISDGDEEYIQINCDFIEEIVFGGEFL